MLWPYDQEAAPKRKSPIGELFEQALLVARHRINYIDSIAIASQETLSHARRHHS